jgi:hypothetical protein
MTCGADRQRASRARLAVGRAILRIEVDLGSVADMLVEGGLLEAWDAEDRSKIAAALQRQIELLVTLSTDTSPEF